MTWRLPLVALVAAVLFVASGDVQQGRAEVSVRDVDMLVQRPDGSLVAFQFVIDADSADAAREAAVNAALQLVPGGAIVPESDGVSAQFAPWWWQWATTEVPVPVAYNPAGAVPGVPLSDIEQALARWGDVEGSYFSFHWLGVTSTDASVQDGINDGQNVIAWRNLDCSEGCVLGVTTKNEAHEVDIILNSNPGARLGDGSGDTVDTWSVLLHEAGHMAGLEHSCALFECTADEQDAVMYFQYRGQKRELRPDDIAGIQSLYPGESSTGGQSVLLQLEVTPGWTLTVLPPGPVDDITGRLSCVDAIYSYDSAAGRWDIWVRGLHPLLQGIATIESGHAHWVHATASCSHLFSIAQ